MSGGPKPPEVRAACLHGYLRLAETLGLDAAAQLRGADLATADIADPDNWISALSVVRLLHSTSETSGRDDIGLLLSERRRLSTLGLLGLVLRDEPDVGGAVTLLLRHERSYNEAMRLEFDRSGDPATVRIRIDVGRPAPTLQATDLAVGVLVGILQVFLGPEWTPTAVCFSHDVPNHLDTYVRLLGDRLEFGHPFTGVVLTAAELDQPNDSSDPILRPYSLQLLANLPTGRSGTTVERVRELVEMMLPMGRCSVEHVARTMDVDRRTLHRHLAEYGQTFTSVVHATRGSLAERHLANPRYSLTDVSQLLGFGAPSAFSRWFRDQYGTSPRDWRHSAAKVG